jgi:hypothetical protein
MPRIDGSRYPIDSQLEKLITSQVGPLGERVWPVGVAHDAGSFGYHTPVVIFCRGPARNFQESLPLWTATIDVDRRELDAVDRSLDSIRGYFIGKAFDEVMRVARARGFGLPVFRMGNRWRPRFPRLQMARTAALVDRLLT